MAYVGLHEQIRKNNVRSTIILACFPLLILAGVYAFFYFTIGTRDLEEANYRFLMTVPFVAGGVIIWFLIAWFANASLIRMATQARPLERKENMRVYNLTENLCMTVGMKMPQLFVIDSPALNAFASGIDEKSYAVTLTTGIIEHLNDEELEGVIAHELTHIRNRDVRLLIISIIFVGILSFVVQILFRSVLYGSGRRRNKDDNKLVLVALVIAAVAYLLSILFKFALSRKREYLADAGAVEMTRNTKAMASALRKISGNSEVEEVRSDDVKQMFIEHKSLSGLFSTHPPIEKRIAVLEQM
jgi:heat shock protein HtpX